MMMATQIFAQPAPLTLPGQLSVWVGASQGAWRHQSVLVTGTWALEDGFETHFCHFLAG